MQTPAFYHKEFHPERAISSTLLTILRFDVEQNECSFITTKELAAKGISGAKITQTEPTLEGVFLALADNGVK